MPFNIGLTGLNAASTDLQVTGHNIANASTAGFKGSRAEFADVFAMSYTGISKTATGSGTRLAAVSQQFTQGDLEFTDNNLDLAINGQGFFILERDGVVEYTRAGQFQLDKDGYVVNSAGQRLQGYATPGLGGPLQDIRLTTGLATPRATTEITALMNLPATAEEPDQPWAWDAAEGVADPDGYNHSTALSVYDSQGLPRTMTLYFRKEPGTTNEWTFYSSLEGDLIAGPETLEFNPDGTLGTGGPFNITHTVTGPNGPENLEFEIDFSNTTQYGERFTVNSLKQDGYASGGLISLDVEADGTVFARFSNGTNRPLGQVALANFDNPQGLRPVGGTNWVETFESGERLLGQAGDSSFGLIQGGAFENSNVNISEQLVKLITAQRNFQANAQVISTADTLTQTIINIR
ncbi:flagellar hook protein FlgE [Ectothiorhodospira shaposhnikovii]|uniref:flagellar hook protein FlgE n=1 Tax=Ectothiorhodospira shaposhnikovii TaxID=1054 RepID=UPI0019078796|nr:flagellar hook protein FlgE [Ectothiorhodospira shaposhnikovii]MBK1673451.1 flagellar hook protein FlgE [Ectothiorhodospira shaposhnikovii]